MIFQIGLKKYKRIGIKKLKTIFKKRIKKLMIKKEMFVYLMNIELRNI